MQGVLSVVINTAYERRLGHIPIPYRVGDVSEYLTPENIRDLVIALEKSSLDYEEKETILRFVRKGGIRALYSIAKEQLSYESVRLCMEAIGGIDTCSPCGSNMATQEARKILLLTIARDGFKTPEIRNYVIEKLTSYSNLPEVKILIDCHAELNISSGDFQFGNKVFEAIEMYAEPGDLPHILKRVVVPDMNFEDLVKKIGTPEHFQILMKKEHAPNLLAVMCKKYQRATAPLLISTFFNISDPSPFGGQKRHRVASILKDMKSEIMVPILFRVLEEKKDVSVEELNYVDYIIAWPSTKFGRPSKKCAVAVPYLLKIISTEEKTNLSDWAYAKLCNMRADKGFEPAIKGEIVRNLLIMISDRAIPSKLRSLAIKELGYHMEKIKFTPEATIALDYIIREDFLDSIDLTNLMDILSESPRGEFWTSDDINDVYDLALASSNEDLREAYINFCLSRYPHGQVGSEERLEQFEEFY